MIGLIWNIRGMNKVGRIPALASRMKDNHVDFVGIIETKKDSYSPGFLKSITTRNNFSWCSLPASGSAGGILVGANSDKYFLTLVDTRKFSISVMLMDNKTGYSWKLSIVYGSPYEEGKQEFLDELHAVMASWKGPTLIGGDFNLVRFARDKSNGVISHRWSDAFNDWISHWGLVELDLSNKQYTWTNNQENMVMARIDRIFVSTEWERAFPLARFKALNRLPSDHNPLLVELDCNMSFGKKGLGLKNGG